jgi:hypothetical protein
MILSWILDMLYSMSWLVTTPKFVQNLYKVTEGIFLYKLSCDIDKYAYMIFVAYNIIILEPNFWLLSCYTKMRLW